MKNILKHSMFGIAFLPLLGTNMMVINPSMIVSANGISNLQALGFDSISPIIGEVKQEEEKENSELTKKAAIIDEYFSSRNLPLAGHGMEMVLAAEKYDIDWRLLPALAMRETTGGKFACVYTYKKTGNKGYYYNVFGWGSCKITFDSYADAFDTVAKNLSGNNPKTARYYAGKDIDGILKAYNPPSIVPNYSNQVIAIMDILEKNS